MKIERISIRNFRGIRSIDLRFGCENAVIWGPNGSGKSAVVDAIDFLLTNEVPRLMGDGTQGITVPKHGPHIDYVKKRSEVSVEAEVRIPGISNAVLLARSMEGDGDLSIKGASKQDLSAVMGLAKRKQHSLSRREVLKYISSQTATRSKQIQELLSLEELNGARKSVVAASNTAKNELQNASTELRRSSDTLRLHLGTEDASEASLLKAMNECRVLLGADNLQVFPRETARDRINAGELSKGKPKVNPEVLSRNIQQRIEVGSDRIQEIRALEQEIDNAVLSIRSDSSALTTYNKLDLLKQGLSLIDQNGGCPLCGHEWGNREELESSIGARLEAAEEVAPALAELEDTCARLSAKVESVEMGLNSVSEAAELLEDSGNQRVLENFSNVLAELKSELEQPVPCFVCRADDGQFLSDLLQSTELLLACRSVCEGARNATPAVSPQQTAWETLTKIDGSLPGYLQAKRKAERATVVREYAMTLHDSFINARDAILGSLYEEIKNRFAELYKQLHSKDEDSFDATLSTDGKFMVDFYGRGMYPPGALHSEGHQDSMGLCLYLALAERLTAQTCLVTVLDDVVMSVDAGHRKAICRILKDCFSKRQFIITTHDRTWMRQLQTEGVVTRSGSFEFSRWTIADGPCVSENSELFASIERELAKSDAAAAAGRLRRGAESFFEHVCDALAARVVYKSSGEWDLGDYMLPAIARMKELVKHAKNSAGSWGRSEQVKELKAFDSRRAEVVARTQCEQWGVNASVHFNKWHELGPSDLRPIVQAFRECFQLYKCSSCESLLRIAWDGTEPVTLTCTCGAVSWSLGQKK